MKDYCEDGGYAPLLIGKYVTYSPAFPNVGFAHENCADGNSFVHKKDARAWLVENYEAGMRAYIAVSAWNRNECKMLRIRSVEVCS